MIAQTLLPSSRRGGLLALVVAAHAGLLLLIGATRPLLPAPREQTIEVALLLPQSRPEPPPSAGKSLPIKVPARKPTPAKPHVPTPTPATPAIEATTSAVAPTAAAPAATTTQPTTGAEGKPAASRPNGQGGALDAVSKARFDADYLHNPAPPYPPQARRMSEEGKVILRVEVSAEGRAENIEIKTSSGSARLDESALRTVRSWRFIPAKRGETAVDSWVLVPIIFKLEH